MTASAGSQHKPTNGLNQLILGEIDRLTVSDSLNAQLLEEFAQFVIVNHKKKDLKPPKPAKPKALSLSELKSAVLQRFGSADVKALRANKDFQMAMAGEEFGLRTRADWLKLYRQWIGVPEDERSLTGPTTINGIDVLVNYRPWIVFGLSSKTATVDDVNEVYRKLVMKHHPDHGGDPRVFQQLQAMRDTLLAFFK